MNKKTGRQEFRIKEYRIALEGWKMPGEGTFCFLTDLHGKSFGKNNEILIRRIREIGPDLILCGGDMNVRSLPSTLKTAYHLLSELVSLAPVIMAPGNHESGMDQRPDLSPYYRKYLKKLKKAGVTVLLNENCRHLIGKQPVTVTGTDLPLKYYKKPCAEMLTKEDLEDLSGLRDPDSFNILLSHNPRYADAYFEWGADLTLSGHTHGGVMRLSEHVGAFSPQDLIFPKYCCGDFYRNGSALIVSGGLGEHTIPVRIHDPRELIVVRVRSKRI